MIFKQYSLPWVSHASYLIGDEANGLAIVVDPQRDVDQYVHDAEGCKLTIQYIFLTHLHSDFVAGHLELQDLTDATICLGPKASVDFPFQAVSEGFEVDTGTVRFRVLETPGHSPEGISLLVFDLRHSHETPFAVLTGDTLLIGDVGHPDLVGSDATPARPLAKDLYDSLHEKLGQLPDETRIYPAHVVHTLCQGPQSHEVFSTLGTQRKQNPALQPMGREAFVDWVIGRPSEPLPYFQYDSYLNRRKHPRMNVVLEKALQPLSLNQVLHWKTSRAYLLDVRDSKSFASGYLVDSLNVGLNGMLESWVGTLLQPKNPIVVIAEPGQEREAVLRLCRIGYDHVVGYLKQGMEALKATPELVRSVQTITVEELNAQLMNAKEPSLLDVRTLGEWSERQVGRSVNVPLDQLSLRLQEVPPDRDLVVYSSAGYRSSIAVSLLQKHGFSRVKHLAGGFDAWEEAIVNPLI